MKDNNQPKSKCRTEGRIETYARRAGKALVGLTTAALLASPFATDKTALADKKEEITVPISQVTQHVEECELSADQWSQEEVTISPECVSEDYLKEIGYGNYSKKSDDNKDTSISGRTENSNFGPIDLFELHDGDNDEEVEMMVVNNTADGARIAFYPFWESEGDGFNKIYNLSGKEIMDTSSHDIDGDDKAEFAVFTENNAYLFDGNQKDQDFDIKNFHSSQDITDGILTEDGLLVSKDEPMGPETYGIYEIDEKTGQWKPYERGDFNMKKLIEENITKPRQEYGNTEINPGPIDEFIISDDGYRLFYTCIEVGSGGKGAQYYVINTEENDSVPQSSPNYVLPWGNIPEDIMYGNFEPQFTSKNSFILYFEVPEDKARAYNPEKGTTTDWVSNLKRSGLDITDFDVYPVDAMSEEARRVTGNLTEYVNYWKEIASKDGNIYYPFVLSTDNSDENGLVVTEDRDFRREENRKPYFFDFNYKNFLDSTSDMNIEELSGEE